MVLAISFQPGNDSGCTAVVALIRGSKLFVANAGDSRCIVCRDGKAVELSDDHKPEDQAEMTRIERAGGRVTPDGRVNGGLNLSRALGDHAYKTNKNLPLQVSFLAIFGTSEAVFETTLTKLKWHLGQVGPTKFDSLKKKKKIIYGKELSF